MKLQDFLVSVQEELNIWYLHYQAFLQDLPVLYLSLLLVLTVSRRRDRLTNNKAEKDIKIPVKVYFTGIFC